jgi:hypothetical protein
VAQSKADGAQFTDWIQEALSLARSLSAAVILRIFPMSISSIAAPAPVSTPDTSAPKAPDVANDNNANDAGAAAPTPLPPLPPGQGTRIDQIV